MEENRQVNFERNTGGICEVNQLPLQNYLDNLRYAHAAEFKMILL